MTDSHQPANPVDDDRLANQAASDKATTAEGADAPPIPTQTAAEYLEQEERGSAQGGKGRPPEDS